jgi:hypothetical protein
MGGYRRDVAHKVLRDDYAVVATCAHSDADCEVWDYRRAVGGKEMWIPHTFDVGLAAYPPDTLLEICRGVGLENEFPAIAQKIIALNGWVGRRP